MIMTYGESMQQALYDALNEDPNVVLFGEDVRSNLYGYTDGLLDAFGEERVVNIPLSEAGVMGVVCGAAMCGLRPILDLTLPNFLYVAMDQIASIAAKTCYMYNGEYSLPLTIFCSSMCGSGNAAQHSDRLHGMFMSIPGLKIICPASPQDMYSLLREAIQDNNPVLCFADRSLFWQSDEVTRDISHIIGKANVVVEGSDLTLVTVSACLSMTMDILPELNERGISTEIIDIRSVNPLDFDTIKKSAEKTGRVMICDTANKAGSAANEISSFLAQNAFYALKAPIQIVAGENIPVPFSKMLEKEVLVSKEKILDRILTSYIF